MAAVVEVVVVVVMEGDGENSLARPSAQASYTTSTVIDE